MIPFNRPFLTGDEAGYLQAAMDSGQLAGNGEFTHRCQELLESRYGFPKCLLTTSGTDALEMAALLTGVGPGDEVIVPSYTFVSTALAFVRQGATIVFADSCPDHPNLSVEEVRRLLTPRTKVVVPVHYAGCACDLAALRALCDPRGVYVVEDAAQAVDARYHGVPLGRQGALACFSFHETKNVSAGGEGGLLVVNDERFFRRAEILWEKGTNRAEFFRGAVNKYGWVDLGSSFLPSELNAAFLLAQLEHLDEIQRRRLAIWQRYADALSPLAAKGGFALPVLPAGASNNGHGFYLVFADLERRTRFIAAMKERGIVCSFHYLPLHSSDFYRSRHDGRALPNCDRFADCLVRLPLFAGLTDAEADAVIAAVAEVTQAI